MGCLHSTRAGGMKTHGTDTDTVGVHFHADPEVHPGILQLAEVGYFLGGGGGSKGLQITSKRKKSAFDAVNSVFYFT